MWGDQITEENELNKYGKYQQHIRVKSTSQPAIKHIRVYSTIEARKWYILYNQICYMPSTFSFT